MSNTELYPEEYRDTKLYLKCMWEARDRISLISSVVARQITIGRDDFAAELIFLQFRKVLELIAFASLTANRVKYSAAHARFAEHWRAKDMLKELAKVNPDFYPMPLKPPVLQEDSIKHFPAVTEVRLARTTFAVRCIGLLLAQDSMSTFGSDHIRGSHNPFQVGNVVGIEVTS
jgi:hypothetical protein